MHTIIYAINNTEDKKCNLKFTYRYQRLYYIVSVTHTIFLAEQKCFQCSLKRSHRARRFNRFW